MSASSSSGRGIPDMVRMLAAQAAADKELLRSRKLDREAFGGGPIAREERPARASSPLRKKPKTVEGGLYGSIATIKPDPQKDRAFLEKRQAHSRMQKLPPLAPADASKVIFLDIDGVMRPMGGGGFDQVVVSGEMMLKPDTADFIPSAVMSLRHVVEHTGAVIVVTSEWRRVDVMRDAVNKILAEYEMPAFASWTRTDVERSTRMGIDLLGEEAPGQTFVKRRAKEVSEWLKSNPRVSQWVMLDPFDMSMADDARQQGVLLMTNRVVQTNHRIGLTLKNAKAAVQLLRGEKLPPQILDKQPFTG